MEINLTTTVGLDPILLHHFISYYKTIGVDNFYVVLWGDSKKVKYDEIVEVLDNHGLSIYKDYRDVNTNDNFFLSQIYNEIISTKPEEWWVVADLDEFNVFPKDIKSYISKLISNNKKFACGLALDRIGEEGEFCELSYDDNIWEKFPNVGFVSKLIRKGDVRSIPLLKGNLKLALGQHYLELKPPHFHEFDRQDRRSDFWKKNMVETHHFRWSKESLNFLKDRGNWWLSCLPEMDRTIRYMLKNEKININNPKYLIERSPQAKYGKYSNWREAISAENKLPKSI